MEGVAESGMEMSRPSEGAVCVSALWIALYSSQLRLLPNKST